MTQILTDFSEPALVEAIEANQYEYLMDLGRSPQVPIHQDPELTWFLIGVRAPGFNRVVRAQFKADDLSARIEAALAPFKGHGLPMTWHTGPATRPAHLGQHLAANGLIYVAEEPGMAAYLPALVDDRPPPPGLRIELVQDPAAAKTWCLTAARGFEFSQEVGETMAGIEADLVLDWLPTRRLYLGLLDGEPVATTLLFLGAGVAGLYGIATIPEVRRRGIGRAMTVAPLLEARAEGYQIGVLHASPMGEEFYRRLGFREYCRLGRYVWRG
jgi:ribosomal protein S18 acetylase RimI-like enzyme